MQVTAAIKSELWRRQSSKEYPSEWDGSIYGGGKISQRFWEYFRAIELLDLSSDSVVLDIGGGSPVGAAGFFANLLCPFVKEVHVMDPYAQPQPTFAANLFAHPEMASHPGLRAFFAAHTHITHVASISVMEHIPDAEREKLIQGIDEFFLGDRVVLTLEYHPARCSFEYQLTEVSLARLARPFTRFYLDAIDACPAPSAFAFLRTAPRIDTWKRRIKLWIQLTLVCFKFLKRFDEQAAPAWYPLALSFRRCPGAPLTS